MYVMVQPPVCFNLASVLPNLVRLVFAPFPLSPALNV